MPAVLVCRTAIEIVRSRAPTTEEKATPTESGSANVDGSTEAKVFVRPEKSRSPITEPTPSRISATRACSAANASLTATPAPKTTKGAAER